MRVRVLILIAWISMFAGAACAQEHVIGTVAKVDQSSISVKTTANKMVTVAVVPQSTFTKNKAAMTVFFSASNTPSDSNIPISYNATYMNMFVGPGTGNSSVTGTQNIAIGIDAGASLTSPMGGSAQDDTFIGFKAGYSCTTCRESIFIGPYAGYTAIGNDQGIEDGLNTMIGSYAGYLDNGIDEVFIGQKAGVGMSGNYTSNSDNTFIGPHSGSCWSSGIQNVFIGRVSDSGSTNCTGNGNTFVGYNAAEAAEIGVANNTCIGSIACFSLTTSVDTMVGHNAGWQTTTGTNDTFVGDQAGASNVTGGNNTEVGESACYNATGSDDICLGYNTNPNAAGDNNEIVIGEGATGHGSNSTTIGNSSSTKLFLYGVTNAATGDYVCYKAGVIEYDTSTCTLSLRKYKQNILLLTGSLVEVMKLRPVQYQYKPELNLGNQTHVGLIAEEVQKVDPRLAAYKDDGELESVDYEHLTAVLIKAVQEQQAEITILTREVRQLQKKR